MATEEKNRKRIFGTFILVLALLIAALLATGAIITSRTGRHVSTYTPPLIVHEAKYEPPASEVFVETDIPKTTDEAPEEEESDGEVYFYDPEFFKQSGVIYADGVKYTWYSQRVLPGGGLDIPGRHVDMGFVMDGQNRIVVASVDYPKGTELDIPFGYGKGIVLDTGWLEHNQVDIYTDF